MVFCLDDGTRLQATGARDPNATWNLPQVPAMPPGPTVASPRSTVPPAQSTITAGPEQFQAGTPYRTSDNAPASSRKSVLPWVFAMVVVIGVSGVLMAWLLTRGKTDEMAKSPMPTPAQSPSATPYATTSPAASGSSTPGERSPTPNQPTKQSDQPKPTPTPEREQPKPMFAIMNNTSFSGGSRITYYPRASVGQCQADCAGNANCKVFTWIRPGAYNPGDSAMCYLMASVTGKTTHACCISGVRN